MANVIEILLTANNQASAVLQGFTQSLDGVGGKLIGVGATLTAITAPITGFFATAIQQAADQQTQLAQLGAVLRSTGRDFTETSKMANALADSLSKVTRYSDDTILSAENMLLTFTSIGNDIFPDVTKAVLDLSTAMGQDLKSSAIQVGKALNDPIAGITALRRVGVQFTDAQEEMIKSLVETGDLLGAQKLILAELNKEFGGSAEAAGKTFAGALDILKNKFGELQERVGFVLIYALQPFFNKVGDVIDRITAWAEANPELFETLIKIGAVLIAVGPALVGIGTALKVISAVAPLVSLALGAIASPVVLIIGALTAAGVALNAFSDSASTLSTAVGSEWNARFGETISLFERLTIEFEKLQASIAEKGLFRGLGEEIKYAFTTFEDGSSVISAFLQTLGMTRDQAERIGADINEGLIGQIGRAIGDFIAELPTNLSLVPFYFSYYFGKIWSAVGPFVQPIIDWLTGTGTDSLGGALALLPEWIFQNITAPLQGIWLAVQPLVQPIIDWFNNDLGRIIQEVGGWIDTNIVTPLEDLWTTLQPTFQQIADFIETIFQPVLDVINQALDSWEMLRRLGGGQPMRALPGEESPGVAGNPHQLIMPDISAEEALAQQLLAAQGLSSKLAHSLMGMAQNFLTDFGGAIWNMVDGVKASGDKASKAIVDGAAKQGVLIESAGKRVSDSFDASGKQISASADIQRGVVSNSASGLANALGNAFGYLASSMAAQQAPILSGAQQLAQGVIGALGNLWGQITQFVHDNINASQQGWDYSRGVYPPGFTGTPFPQALGGRVAGGMPYRVGERGVETFIPDTSGTILPNGGGRSITVERLELSFPSVNNLTDPRQIERVVQMLIEELDTLAT